MAGRIQSVRDRFCVVCERLTPTPPVCPTCARNIAERKDT